MADLQPYVEECFSDEDSPVFAGRQSPTAANVSTKRSHPSDLDKEKPPTVERVPTNIDVRSDSGYSSYTAATVSSTNSAPSATSQRSPPVVTATPAPVAPAPGPAPKARRPTVSESRQNSTNSSPRPKPLSRTASQSSRPSATRRPTITQDRPERKEHRDRRDSRVDPECTDPSCTKCGPNALPAQHRRLDIQPSQSARDVSRLSVVSDQRSMRSDPAAYYASPPSPTYTRQPAYVQGPAIIQPAAAPRRRASSTARQQRPMSYSGESGAQYWVPGMPAPYPSPPQEHGPPLSNSAQWRGMPPYQMPAMAAIGQMGPPMPPYMGPLGQAPGYPQYAPSYDGAQRPGMHSRNSSNFARNGPPVVTQAPRDQQYSARYGQPQPQPQSATQARFPAQLQLQGEPYDSESESESESEEEEEYEEPDPHDPRTRRALMPPPKITRAKSTSKKERPPMRHAKTTNVADVTRRMSQIEVDARPTRERAPKIYNDPTRRQSVSRPAAPRQTQSDYITPGASILVNKSDRRRSAQTYDKTYEAYAQARKLQDRVRAEAQAAAEAKARKEARARAREKEREEAERKAHAERYELEKAEKERKRQSRTSKVYYQPPKVFDSEEEDDSEKEIPPPAPVLARRRRPTEVESRKGKEPKINRAETAAEDYMSAQRGSEIPLSDHIHRAAKRASRAPSMPSHSGSSGSDRQSQSNRTTMTSNENNEIRLRVDASAPLSLSFNGDMEGRTLRMIPAENGMADIVIGSRNGDSNYQGSERGSVAGDRKALVSRRQQEEMTERSLRSSRSRRDDRPVREYRDERDGQQRPLQRRRASTYID